MQAGTHRCRKPADRSKKLSFKPRRVLFVDSHVLMRLQPQ